MHLAESLAASFSGGLERIRAFHQAGGSGLQVSEALTAHCDRVVCQAYRAALARLSPVDHAAVVEDLALVAVGGYGRGEMAPFSDTDLLFLLSPSCSAPAEAFVSSLVRALWDAGLKLSHSMRTADETIDLAHRELTVRTALMQARLLEGSEGLFAGLQQGIRRLIGAIDVNLFLDELLKERSREHQDYYAETVCLLEPNVKKSPGALRDVHLFRWVAAVRYGFIPAAGGSRAEPAQRRAEVVQFLHSRGVLSDQDAETIETTADFLQRLRNELHFHSGLPQDVLTRHEQVRLARWAGFEDEGGLRAVERFMRHYYRQTEELHDLAMRFADGARSISVLRRLLNRISAVRLGGRFIISSREVALKPRSAGQSTEEFNTLLRLFDLARGHKVRVAHQTLEQVRSISASCHAGVTDRREFLRLLMEPAGLDVMLRNLHRVGLLARLLPAFEHARGLIQFNLYHRYTVDEHSLRAVEAAVHRMADPGPVGKAYRRIRRKDILHLALLLHDLGKGLGPDHCEIGRGLAEKTALDFGLDERERDLLVFLVHQHLLMAHTAFRRDISDPQTLVRFARGVTTPEALQMLYVMTVADTEAVAPGSLTGWKASLLNELFARAMQELTGESPVADELARADAIRRSHHERLKDRFPSGWLEGQLALMPLAYLLATEPERVTEHLRMIRIFGRGVQAQTSYCPQTGLTEQTVLAAGAEAPGIFSGIAGVLAAEGIQVVSAQIFTRSDGLAIDTFRGVDGHFAGEPPKSRLRELSARIEDVLLGRQTVEGLFSLRCVMPGAKPALAAEPPLVEIDNASSERFTIVEVFTNDRPGLLYDLTRTLLGLGLSVHSAKISTHGEQVVDAFYVVDQTGRKIADSEGVLMIRERLLKALVGN